MPIIKNNETVTKVYKGNKEVVKIYKGDIPVYIKQHNIKQFTLSDGINNESVNFNFEEGMNWHDFVNSHYNTNNKFTILLHMIIYNTKNIKLNGVSIKPNDAIIADSTYINS